MFGRVCTTLINPPPAHCCMWITIFVVKLTLCLQIKIRQCVMQLRCCFNYEHFKKFCAQVTCILPTNRKDRYDAIKKFCCVTRPGRPAFSPRFSHSFYNKTTIIAFLTLCLSNIFLKCLHK